MSELKVVGIVLVRNEDRNVRRAVENVAAFCDRIVLADHGSTDDTPQILRDIASRQAHAEYVPVKEPRDSHDLIKDYAGTNTWIFGVDGDEIYDPAGLVEMRARLVSGIYDDAWMILGNVLNCDFVDVANKAAAGWLAPPCRSITKLYNFAHIRSWEGKTPERLHGGVIDFLPGRHALARKNLYEEDGWERTPLRCLHTCFAARSSLDAAKPRIRENIMDVHAASPLRRLRRILNRFRGNVLESDWKKTRYMRGERVSVNAAPFFP